MRTRGAPRREARGAPRRTPSASSRTTRAFPLRCAPPALRCRRPQFAALAFKIMADPFVGTLTFARIYSGTLAKGSSVLNSVKGKKERTSQAAAAAAAARPAQLLGCARPAAPARAHRAAPSNCLVHTPAAGTRAPCRACAQALAACSR